MAGKSNDGKVDLEEVEKWYKELLNDSDFDKWEIELQEPNIFSILGIGRTEIRHSNFLAWLLDPNGSHGLGNRFLIRVLRDLAIDKKNELDIFEINALDFSCVEIGREVSIIKKDKGGFIDILIVFGDNKRVICIENKIDTTDSDGQLKTYREYVEETFKKEDGYENIFVYLTPNGTNPKNKDEEGKWSNYSYAEKKESKSSYGIIKHLEDIRKSLTDSKIKTYISDYLSTLKYEIMGNNHSNSETIANQIFKNHQEIFAFVFKNKSNELNKLEWENYPWIIKFAEKFKDLVKEVNNEIDDDLGYTNSYISIKRNKQIYYLFSRRETEGTCAMDFSFLNTEDKTQIKKSVEDFIEEVKSEKKKKGLKPKLNYSKGGFLTINNVNELEPEEIKKIEKIRLMNQQI